MKKLITSALVCSVLLLGISGCKTVGAIKEDVNSLVARSSTEPVQTIEAPSDRKQLVQEVQTMLAQKGYDPGPVDGQAGPSTNSSLRAFQAAHGLTVTNGVTEEAYIQLKSESQAVSTDKASQADTRECVQNFKKQSGVKNYRTNATLTGVSQELAIERLVRVLGRKGFVINENDASRGYVNATFNAGANDIQLSAFINEGSGGSAVELNYAGTGAGFGALLTPASAYRADLCAYMHAMQSGT